MKRLRRLSMTLFCVCLSWAAFGQSDSCVTAVVISANGTYTADGPATGGNSTNSYNSDWYTFSPSVNGTVTISSCIDPNGTDTRLYLYEGPCSALTEVAFSDDVNGCSPLTNFASEINTFAVSAGTDYYIEWDDSWTTNGFDWEFTFTPAPAIDVGVLSMQSPVASGCGLSNMAPVTVTVANYGTDPVSNIDMSFSVDAVNVATETLAGPLNAGATASYTFTATADLSGPGDHTVEVVATNAGDGNDANDAMSATVTNFSTTTGPLPIFEDFDSYAVGDIVFVDFENLATAQQPWQVNTGGTGSTATGPDDDVTGGGNYIYIEASNAADGDAAVLVSKCLDLTAAINPRLEFAYHMYGSSIKGLSVDISVGGVVTNLTSFAGQQQATNADPWITKSADLTPYVGNIVQLVFTGDVGDDGTGTIFNGDISLDNIFITDPLPTDIGVVSIDSPETACTNTAMETVTVTVQNFGSTDETGFDLSYTIDGPTGMNTVTETFAGTIVAGNTTSFTFAATVDMSVSGTYTLSSTTSIAGDSNTANNETTATLNSGGSVLPIEENFDSYPVGTTVFPSLVNDATDQLEWSVNAGITTSTATGPEDDVSGGGNYLYVETSGSLVGDAATICTDCINLTSALNPRLEFAYHMFGGSIDSLLVYVDNGTAVTTELVILDQQQTATGDPWLNASVDLSAYVGDVVSICFQANVKGDANGDTFNGDTALDEIAIVDPLPMDVGVVSIDSPTAGCTLSATETVEITIQNFGSSTETGFDVSYDVNGTVTTENVGAFSIAPGTSASYAFSATADLSGIGSYDITAYTELAGDPIVSNDSTMVNLVTGGTPYPISDNFDSYPVGTTVFNMLENDGTDDLDWQVNTGITTSTDTGPNQDASGSGNYIYIETSGSLDGDVASICTQCINLIGATNPQLEYSYHLFGGSIGSLEVTIDDGSGPVTLTTYPGQVQTANADPWNKEILDLTAYAGSIVDICFTGTITTDATGNTFNGDMALDEIVVREPPLCPDPYNVMAQNVSDVSADISWISGGSAISATVEYGPTGFVLGTGMTATGTSPINITGLNPETSYDVYVTEDCGPVLGGSITAGPASFMTRCSPFPFPGDLFFAPIVAASLPYTDAASTATCYTDEFDLVSDSPDVFYSFTTDPCANSVTVSLCGSAYDTRLTIVNPVDTSIIVTNDDFCGTQSEITFAADGNTTYYAVVEGFATTSTGSYTIAISETISTGIDAVALASVDPSCPNTADGSINSTVTGGASPFVYSWSNGETTGTLTAIMAGTYSVTVSDNCGGLSTAIVTLTDPAGLLVDAGGGGSVCLGESVGIGGAPTGSLGNPFPQFLENAFAYDALNGGFYKHDLQTPDVPTAINAGLLGDYFAGDFGPDGFYALEATTLDFVKIDTAMGTATVIGTATPNAGHTWTGLAWDGTMFHGLSTDGVAAQLYTIDILTGAATATFAPTGDILLIWLAIDNNGNAYTMDVGTDSLYTVDLATGGTSPIGDIGFDANFAQDADFDPKTNTLYISAYNNGNSQGELRSANLVTGNTTLIGTYPYGGEIAAFGIADLPLPNPPYLYQWSPSAGLDNDTIPNPIATPMQSTTYVVAVSDACGNTVTSEVFVEIKPLPPANAGPDVPLCDMNSVVLTASGGIIYSWDTGDTGASITVSPTVTTTYVVSVTDVNCTAVDSVTVIVSTPVVPTITVNGLVLTSSPASAYQWYFDNMPIPGATGQSHTAIENGEYFVETVDAVGCTANSTPETISTVSIAEMPGVSAFSVFPNPTSDLLKVEIESIQHTEFTLKLIDVVGRTRYEEVVSLNGGFQTTLEMKDLPAGVYFLRLQSDEGSLQRRIVKQ